MISYSPLNIALPEEVAEKLCAYSKASGRSKRAIIIDLISNDMISNDGKLNHIISNDMIDWDEILNTVNDSWRPIITDLIKKGDYTKQTMIVSALALFAYMKSSGLYEKILAKQQNDKKDEE